MQARMRPEWHRHIAQFAQVMSTSHAVHLPGGIGVAQMVSKSNKKPCSPLTWWHQHCTDGGQEQQQSHAPFYLVASALHRW
eukprot:1158371-Pelagomonas_calceolata.AAC.14